MPPLAFLGSAVMGHQTFTPTATILGSPTVLVNSIPAHRVGDMSVPHPGVIAPPHPVVTSLGSMTCLINSMPAARLGDLCACTSMIAMGSPTVIVGG